jgi:GrpB-like predicted nucleotidyltransferase (UPF0157 family)
MTNGPESDAEMAAVHVDGAPKVHDASVELHPYDPAWPVQYAAEEAKIRAALGEAALVLEHVGSTSIPGISAKPIIDIVLAVDDSADEAAYVPALVAEGYRLHIREPDWHEHRLLKGAAPVVNLHVFSVGSPEVTRMVAFRDRCRSHPEERDLYLAAKQALAARTWRYVQHYANAKSEVVEAIIARALADQPPAAQDAGAEPR